MSRAASKACDNRPCGLVIGEINQISRDPNALAGQSAEVAGSNIIGDGVERDGVRVVVVGRLSSDGRQDVRSIFDSASHWPDRVLMLTYRYDKIARREPYCGFDADQIVDIRRAQNAAVSFGAESSQCQPQRGRDSRP